MKIFDSKDKRTGIIGTIVIHLILLILFAIYGLTYPVPLPENGMLINLGYTDKGSGDNQPSKTDETNIEEQITAESTPENTTEVEALTQEEISTVEIPPKKDPIKKPKEEKPITKPTDNEPEKTTEKEPEINKKLQRVLADAFNKNNGSEGDDKNEVGDKGKPDGDAAGESYTGDGKGGSGGGNYSLGNRNALEKIKPDYQCEEYGIVVMSVRVDRTGKTLDAKLKLKGSTNTAPCLVSKAKKAALETKWDPDFKAPEMQIGTIEYHFELN